MGRREENAKRQRAAIVSAAVSVFSRKGFHKGSLEEVAKKAAVGKGTIYLYFEDKPGLFAAAVAEGVDSIITELEPEIESDLPFLEHLDLLLRKIVSLYLRYGDLTKIFHNELSNGLERKSRMKIERARSRMLDFIAGILEEGHRRGYLRKTDFNLAAVGAVGMLDSLCNHQLTSRDGVDEEKTVRVVTALLATGLIDNRRSGAKEGGKP